MYSTLRSYTVSTVDAEKDKRDTDLWMVSWDGADRVRFASDQLDIKH